MSRALGAIGTERMPHRLPGRRGFRAVVADGLSPFGAVGTAVITGMGAATIARILEASPTPRVAVLHAPDRPDALRRWCASHGWRIDAEMLAPEGRRFAQVLRVVRGREPHHGHLLAFGPRLRHDPNLEAHARQCLHRWARIMEVTRHRDPTRSEEAQGWVAFLHDVLQGTAWSHQPPA